MENQAVQHEADKGLKIQPSFSFCKEVEEQSGQPVSRCYQCKKCTGGCPMAFAMDILPSQVVRYVQLGLKDQLQRSRSVWVCASCKTCYSRCPNGIDVSAILDVMKGTAAGDKTVAEPNVHVFHQSFMDSIGKYGRVFEAGMLAGYKMKTKTYSQDLSLGIEMLKRGKLKLLPGKVQHRREIREIFQKAKEKGR
ncbi:MAG: 4Fe-4S dicluster domain-containing protein [Bacillota bacterium]